MPAVNPRLSITLQPELAAILRRLSQLTGNSQSSMVGQLLGEAIPVFDRMVRILEAAEKLRGEAMQSQQEVSRSLGEAQDRVERQLGLALGDMDEGARLLLREAERVKRRRPTAAAERMAEAGGARLPPISNRGVTPTKTRKNEASKAKRKGVTRA